MKEQCLIIGFMAVLVMGAFFEGAVMGQVTGTGEQVAGSFTGQVTKQFAYKYWLYLPRDYDKATPSPLVLFLHGMGERGDDLNRVKVHGPPKMIEAGKHFPFVCVSPQCPDDQVWSPAALTTLLDDIESKYSVDKTRIYVTGLSMGGYGTWTLAAHQPGRFAAIVPICGGASYFDGGQLKDLPIWCFHGGADNVVPLSESERLIALVKHKGNQQAKLTVYEGVGHDSWTETYNNEGVFEWMLSQTLDDSANVD